MKEDERRKTQMKEDRKVKEIGEIKGEIERER